MASKKDGKIITFYSYKGGTGRSMALANTACLLANPEYDNAAAKVLMIDWDLEAPGLHRFFRNHLEPVSARGKKRDIKLHRGLIEYFIEVEKDVARHGGRLDYDETLAVLKRANINKYIIDTDIPNLSLLKAGSFDFNFFKKVNTFQWADLHAKAPRFFRAFAKFLMEKYDYILVDSRTGNADTSGICTMILPQKLVIVFTPNFQSLTGVFEFIRNATEFRRLSGDTRPLAVFPLPSRIDQSEEQLRYMWRYGGEYNDEKIIGYQCQFEALFKKIYDVRECKLEPYFNEVQIQHVPYYSYGEKIAVLEEKYKERLSLSRSYESFMENLVRLKSPWELARFLEVKNRDAYISYNKADEAAVRCIVKHMKRRNISVWFDVDDLKPGVNKSKIIRSVMSRSKAVVIIIGPDGYDEWQKREVKFYVKGITDTNIPIIPVLLPGMQSIPKSTAFLTNYSSIKFISSVQEEEALDRLAQGVAGQY